MPKYIVHPKRMSKPLQVAINLIKPYVERGDSLKSMANMGHCGNGDDCSIGGWMPTGRSGKYWTPDWILVEKASGKRVNKAFKLEEVAQYIKMNLTD